MPTVSKVGKNGSFLLAAFGSPSYWMETSQQLVVVQMRGLRPLSPLGWLEFLSLFLILGADGMDISCRMVT